MHKLSHLLILLFCLCLHADTRAGDLPPGFAEVLVAQDLDPTAMALSPDGRIFITEKNGRILIIENGQLLFDPFMFLEVDNYNERGLSGIAFDPEFHHNGYIYLYYTVKNENHNRISRFTADGNYVVPGSELILIDIDQLNGTIHNAGSMAFGPDNKLYISVGDGANGDVAQSLNSLLGKVLRINSDGSIPGDNPFYNETAGVYQSIYALGLRNSFSMTIQPGTGRIFATEVGSSTWEEVNEIQAGKNYGWPIIEGPINGQTPPANYKDPVFAYNHTDGCAAVGAAFYNPAGSMFPSLYEGKFFFADYCHGYIKYMDPDVPGAATTFATNINRPLNLLVASDGTMYYLARAGLGGGSEQDNTATTNGTLWRVFYTGSGAPFISINPQDVLVTMGEDASFVTAASGDEPLLYQWQRNNVDIPGANSSEYVLQNTMLSDSGSLFRCIVSNGDGNDTTLSALLRVTTNQRPQPEIFTPVEGTLYRGGDTISFSGHSLDLEDGELNALALRWKIDFHHNVHTHPGLAPTTGITEGEFIIPQTGETSADVWYRIYLTATDAVGLSTTISREVFPYKTQFHVHTIPSGLPVYIESDFLQSPASATSVVGVFRRIEVLPSIVVGDSIRLFTQWTDGELTISRSFPAQDDTITYTAVYETYPLSKGTGIRGYYYDGNQWDPTFYEPYAFTWIDTTIDYDWGGGSPAVSQLGDDFWLVRWEGFVQPLFDETYDFHVLADDGIRLWVDDELIIDAWVLQAPTEWTGTIDLEAGKKYPVKLEFYEEGGGAVCRLYWSSDKIGKSIIPRSQLFPDESTSIYDETNPSIPIIFYPNPVKDILTLEIPDQAYDFNSIEITNSLGQLIYQTSLENRKELQIDLRQQPGGMYWVKCYTGNGGFKVFQLVKQ